jgi:hypothetical protein
MDERAHTARRQGRAGREPARYDRDLYSWALEQAALLRAGRTTEIDAANIAEELDDIGNEQYDKVERALRVILLHLLKWDHQPERRLRSWRASVVVQRNHVQRVLKKNPGLKPHIEEALEHAYTDARVMAGAQTRLGEAVFPARCPYSWQQIMQRPIDWPPADARRGGKR